MSFEKVNPAHPDKICDRIAGAIIDLSYAKQKDVKMAVEVLLGHNRCMIITEGSVKLEKEEVSGIVRRITKSDVSIDLIQAKQDSKLAQNQKGKIRCADNGIFKGTLITEEQKKLVAISRDLYQRYRSDGKYLLDEDRLVICQSNAKTEEIKKLYPEAVVNPIGEWTGGSDVDTGAVNRKLGSDLADAITGGGIHGKDASKADVTLNILCFLKAQETGENTSASCAIGDEKITYKIGNKKFIIPYEKCVSIALDYIATLGGFEKMAEWGLVI